MEYSLLFASVSLPPEKKASAAAAASGELISLVSV
jgi:hypothetical protein